MAIPILLFAVALAVRAITAALFLEPAYPDSYYYVNVAQQLASGGGFNVDFIWNFVEVGGSLPAVGVLPIPSNAHWMPLAAIVQVPFIWVLGPTALAAALPFWIAAAAVAPLTYFIGRDAGMPTWQAGAAGLLVAMPAAVSPFLGQPDNFALFMLLGGLALWLCARGIQGSRWSFALGGLIVGLAFLSRNDGVLLGVPFALAFLYDVLRRPHANRIGWWAAFACVAGFVLVAAPWLLRQLDVFGSLSPSSVGGRILFINEYRELYSVTTETTLESFLAQGVDSIIKSRLDGLGSALIDLRGAGPRGHPRAIPADRSLAAQTRPPLPALVHLRGGVVELQRDRFGRARAQRDIPTFGGGPDPACLPVGVARRGVHGALGGCTSRIVGC